MVLFHKFFAAIKKRLRFKGKKIRKRRHPKIQRKKGATKRKAFRFRRSTVKILKRKSRRKKTKTALRRFSKPKKQFRRLPVVTKSIKKTEKILPIGEVTHYFSKISVCVIKVKRGVIVLGDTLEFKGHTTGFRQQVKSLQIENSDVKSAHKGQLVGLKVHKKTRAGDAVYKALA